MKYILALITMMVFSQWCDAQKVGHINFGNLLEGLPQVTAAEKNLETYQDSLAKALETKVLAHRTRIQENKQKYDAGELTKVDADQINQSLNAEQAKLIEDQKRAEATVMIRKQGYLQPIVAHVASVIENYGKDNGYEFIIDESSGLLLFDQPSDDLTETIRALLNE